MVDRHTSDDAVDSTFTASMIAWQCAKSFLFAAVILFAGTLAVGSRAVPLDSGLWLDEIFTIQRFVSRGAIYSLTTDYNANNHILFSTFSSYLTYALGSDQEWVYRLGAFLPSVASIAVLFWWLLRKVGRGQALAFMVLLAASPVHAMYSWLARGYGLAFLAVALLIIASVEIAMGNQVRYWVLFCVASFVGTATLPVFGLAAILCGAYCIASGSDSSRSAMLMRGRNVVLCAIPTVTFWLPRIGGLLEASGQEFGRTLSFADIWMAPYHHHVAPSLALLSSSEAPVTPAGMFRPESDDLFVALGLLLTLLVLALLVGRMSRDTEGAGTERRHRTVVLCALITFGTYAALFVSGLFVAGRFVSFLVIPVWLAVAILLGYATGHFEPTLARALLAIAYASLATLSAVMVMNCSRFVASYGSMPYEAYRQATLLALELSDGAAVYTDSKRPIGFEYYAQDGDVDVLTSSDLVTACAEDSFTFIHHPLFNEPIEDTCVASMATVKIDVRQRGRGGVMQVFHRALPE